MTIHSGPDTEPMKKPERYFLGTDNSSHWYLVPVSKSTQFFKWADLDEDDPKGWTAPKWAKQINGPGSITFSDPSEK
jgi:hypothetical protein